jgi:hypothetical protein
VRCQAIRSATFFGVRSSCCHTRTTRHPFVWSVLFTSLSRLRFRSSFASQNSLLLDGRLPWMGHLCQKQPSTNTASLAAKKTKSGCPKHCDLRRHPEILCSRKIEMTLSSVAALPRLFTRDMIADLCSFGKMSAISRQPLDPLRGIEATTCDGRRNVIPSHATVNVIEALAPLVAW